MPLLHSKSKGKGLITYPKMKKLELDLHQRILFWALRVVCLLVVSLWAVPTQGYQTMNVISDDYHLEDDQHWWYKIAPWLKGKQLCDAAEINAGTSLLTNTSLFSYTVTSATNSSGGSVGAYAASSLDWCDVQQLSVSVQLFSHLTSLGVSIRCHGPWQATLQGHYQQSANQADRLSNLGWSAIIGIGLDDRALVRMTSIPNRIFYALNLLTDDLYDRVQALNQVLEPDDRLTEWSTIYGTDWCPPKVAELGDCERSDGQGPALYPTWSFKGCSDDTGSTSVQTWNSSFPDDRPIDLNLTVPIGNLLLSLHSAVQYDLGYSTAANIFTDVDKMTLWIHEYDVNDQIHSDDDNPTLSVLPDMTSSPARLQPLLTRYALSTPLEGATKLLDGATDPGGPFPLPAARPSVLAVTYTCRIQHPKSFGSMLIALLGSIIPIMDKLWDTWITVFCFWLSRDRKRSAGGGEVRGGDESQGGREERRVENSGARRSPVDPGAPVPMHQDASTPLGMELVNVTGPSSASNIAQSPSMPSPGSPSPFPIALSA